MRLEIASPGPEEPKEVLRLSLERMPDGSVALRGTRETGFVWTMLRIDPIWGLRTCPDCRSTGLPTDEDGQLEVSRY